VTRWLIAVALKTMPRTITAFIISTVEAPSHQNGIATMPWTIIDSENASVFGSG